VFLHTPPWEVEPWKTIVTENNPGTAPIDVPILVVQSDVDTIVAADVTARFVDRLCERGETVERLRLEGISHHETGHEAAPDVTDWLADRLAGRPVSNPSA
jgi:alpha-beta hydrolase superfamily lysophospholipase